MASNETSERDINQQETSSKIETKSSAVCLPAEKVVEIAMCIVKRTLELDFTVALQHTSMMTLLLCSRVACIVVSKLGATSVIMK